MKLIRPPLLRSGDTMRVVAPANSRATLAEYDHSVLIEQRLSGLGLCVEFGAHVDKRDALNTAPITSRVADIHEAFTDPHVSGVLAVTGGSASNDLLPHLDFDLIRAHPKVFCGHSDITALNNALLARAGLVTFSGPHWSTFGMRDHFDQTLDWFTRMLLDEAVSGTGIEVEPGAEWTDDLWFLDQDDRHPLPNEGWWALQSGTAAGRIVGGNLCTLNLLQGTPWMPPLDGVILFVEDDHQSRAQDFARDLTSLLQLPDAAGIRGLVIGRFQRASAVRRSHLEQIIANQPVLAGVPVLANADYGHTSPLLTLPIGGDAVLDVGDPGSGSRLHLT